MFLDIEFKDFFSKTNLAKCSMRLADFALHVQKIFLLKSKKYNGNPNHFKNHVRYTIHCLLANNYNSKINKIHKIDIVEAASELWFGHFLNFSRNKHDIFSISKGDLHCFPQYMYHKNEILSLGKHSNFSMGNHPVVSRKSNIYNRVISILINDSSYSNFSFNKEKLSEINSDNEIIYNFINQNNLYNLIIEDSSFTCKFGEKEELTNFQQVAHIYENLYFGINIYVDEPNELKYSKYNVVFEHNSKYYIFNTWHGNLVEIDKDNFLKIKNKTIIDDISYREMGFIVPVETDEFKLVYLENEKYLSEKSFPHVTICPTFKCNANCAYCFENGVNKNLVMNDQVINKLTEHIKSQSINNKCKITWFGGEPLMGSEQINQICDNLKKLGVEFTSTMITNGYLLDCNIMEIKNLWNCKKIQITLDGLGEKYDVIKRFGFPAFDKIIKNIHLCLDYGISISIRINYDSENCNDYFEMIEFVRNEFGDKVKLYFHDIMGEDYLPPFLVKPNPLLAIFKKMKNVGYRLRLKDLKIRRTYASCAINKPDFVIVEPNGDLTKCEHYVGKKSSFSCGSILNDVDVPGKVIENMNECSKCLYFPICGGGCYANHLDKKFYGCTRIKGILIDLLKLYLEEE